MQQASAASFFPTAKELSSGVQWFKDHPVLAAAAATAVSVITYLNALELEAEVHQSEEPQPAIASSKHKRPLSSRRSKGSPSLVRKGSGASDGKLSAAVSWCDEHGGSLTQVFEDDTLTHRRGRRLEESDSDDETRDDVAESYQDAFQQHRALAKSVTMQQLDAGVATSDSEGDISQTESPQWGWYVAITPPQDQFQATGRGSEVLSCSEQSKAGVKTIRRTTSGQIQ